MQYFTAILLLIVSAHCNGFTFDSDTIDNWQIYNGTSLLLAGHGAYGAHFQTSISKSDLTDLLIIFNHCTLHSGLDVSLEITDEKGRKLLTKVFTILNGERIMMRVTGAELRKIISEFLEIHYCEDKENGASVNLGRIELQE